MAVVVIGLFLSPVTQAGRVVLVENGAPRAAVVIPDDPIPVHEFAARELRYHVNQATGADLPLYTESETPNDVEFTVYIGVGQAARAAGIDPESLPPSGHIVRTRANALFLVGRDRERGPREGRPLSHWIGNRFAATWQGSLYAVYDFLETEMGVRWLWPGELGEHIPHSDNLAVGPLDRRGEPRLEQPELAVAGRRPRTIPYWSSPEHHQAFQNAQRLFLIRHRFGATQSLHYGHAFADYWERYGESNPGFFNALPDGTRRPLEGDPAGRFITLCVSEPTLGDHIISEWESSPLRNPENVPYTPCVNACENDTPGMCACARCRAWDAPDPGFETHAYWGEGRIPHRSRRFTLARAPWGELDDGETVAVEPPSLSDRYARFYRELLHKARVIDPDACVAGYAYANYWKAPVDPDLDLDGVLIIHVPPLRFPYTESTSAEFRKSWLGWHRLGARLMLRPNLTHAGANLPIFYARQLASDFSFAAEHGMVGTRFDSLLGAWSAQGPTMYVLTRIHHRPDWSADRILDEYYAAFGAAEPGVRAYFGYWERHSNALDPGDVSRYGVEEQGGGFKNYVRIAHRLFQPEHFAEARALLNEARRQAAGDALALRRVAYLEQGLTDAELTAATRAAQAYMEREGELAHRPAFEAAFRRMMEHRRAMEAGGDHPSDIGYFASREQSGSNWPHRRPPPPPPSAPEEAFRERLPESPQSEMDVTMLRQIEDRTLPRTGWLFRVDPERDGDTRGWHRPEASHQDWREAEIETAWATFLGESFVGVGWYRRALDVPALPESGAAYLHFEGVDESCWVWVNGIYAGHHHIGPAGWNVPFRIEITPAVWEGENTIIIRVMNTAAAGGIWRPVRLEVYEVEPE